ncbi:hypothetical protein [aff. Roholtiella sp. LEGE 12411]|uniref:hypothetical protein n=1 Tax=aff. Roholtiella sp. LEGE 12411 TaxID=1828822 RepID=UPI00187E3C92|nr:hypothetical protein [aff. Roholtiella sp. LEGE 12411]MBE9037652.1 hypothetical protein [aff. Roholtiella sp. LEGE 12411]
MIISNPPFSKCVEFVERSLCLLNPDNPESRILFLLPLDWTGSKERGNAWRKLNAHISHTSNHGACGVSGRVGSTANQKAVRGRRI